METIKEKQFSILAVDDNPKNIQVIGSILREAGYSVGFAFDGKQALLLLKGNNYYDLVLLDVNMPVMNGFETCKAMRKEDKLKEIPVIFLTALVEPDDIINGFEAGGQDYVTKPFNSKELLSRVKTHLELKHAKDQLKRVNQWLEEKVEERTKELQEANSKLEAANRELETLDKAKTDFLSIISHEINTPLNGIIGFIDILKDELTNSELYEMLRYLEISARRLEHFSMVSLRITELRTKNRLVKKEDIRLDHLIETTKENLAEQIEAKGINLCIEGEVNNSNIFGEKELIKFCFASILKNAINYSAKGDVITIRINSDREQTVCSFIDQGNGFSPNALNNLYQLFAPGEHHVEGNKGLDLALVKFIMDAHKGEIKVSNNAAQGAAVTLTFPTYSN
jgi:two-component system sensor histidine kinase/response regulator